MAKQNTGKKLEEVVDAALAARDQLGQQSALQPDGVSKHHLPEKAPAFLREGDFGFVQTMHRRSEDMRLGWERAEVEELRQKSTAVS